MSITNEGRRITLSNEEQLWLMSQVKQNMMTIDEAVSWTANRETELRSMEDDIIQAKDKEKVAAPKNKPLKATKKFKSFLLQRKPTKPYIETNKRKQSFLDTGADTLTAYDLKNKQIYNFSVYRCAKHKSPQKRILQIDFDAKCLSLIHRGNVIRTSPFASLATVDGQEGKKLFIYFDDSQELEINAENLTDKTKLIRLLNIVSEQNEHEERGQHFDPCDKLQQSFKVIKEGYLEKKGGYSASQWHKRLVVIRSGELAYYRVEEEELSAALNIIHLSPGSVAISAEDDNTFTIATTKESHRFRLPDNASLCSSGDSILADWIQAIHDGCSRAYESQDFDDNSPVRLNGSISPTDSFHVIFHEIEKLKKGLDLDDDRNGYEKDQMEELLFILKELQECDAKKQKRSRVQKKRSLDNRRVSKLSQGTDNTTKSMMSSCSSLSSATKMSYEVENVYDLPVGHMNGIVVPTENAYDMAAEESTSFAQAPPITNGYADLSDDEKITSFSCVLPLPPAPEPKTPLDTPPSDDFSDLPPPPPSLCNGDVPAPPSILQPSSDIIQDSTYCAVSYDQVPHNPVNPLIQDEVYSLIENGVAMQLAYQSSQTCHPPAPTMALPPPPTSEASPVYIPSAPPTSPPPPPPVALSNAVPTPPPPGMEVPPPPGMGVPPPPGIGVPPPPEMGVPNPPHLLGKPPLCKGKMMRPFHWVPVPRQMISKSMWKNAPDLSSVIEIKELHKQFQSIDKKQEKADETPKKGGHDAKKKQFDTYLDHKTAQNLGIFLSGFKLRGEELTKKLSIVSEDSGGISTEHVVNLRKFAPEPELKALYAKHAGRENEELAKEDRFLAELCRIPRLGLRLETLQIVRELPGEIENVQPEVDLVLTACLDLLRSKLFENFLHYILAVTNCINATNTKGTTRGIRLSTLQKTNVMRTNDKKQTLLQIVLKIVKETKPEILSFQDELTSVCKSQTYSIKGLSAEIDIMRKSSFKVRKNCDLLRRKKNQPTKDDLHFCSDIERLKNIHRNLSAKIQITSDEERRTAIIHNELAKIDSVIAKMNEKCLEIRHTLSKVLVKFGEPPDTDNQELFGWVRNFIDDVRKNVT